VERDEDDAMLGLQHKSVLRLTRSPIRESGKSPKSPKPTMPSFTDSINYWLSQATAPPTLDVNGLEREVDAEFDFIRERIESITSGASFEVVHQSKSETVEAEETEEVEKPKELFTEHFEEINGLPLDHWLVGAAHKTPTHQQQHKRKLVDEPIEIPSFFPTPSTHSTAQPGGASFEFERVIRSIQRSADDQWLMNGLGNGLSCQFQGSLSLDDLAGTAKSKKMRMLSQDPLVPQPNPERMDYWLSSASRSLARRIGSE